MKPKPDSIPSGRELARRLKIGPTTARRWLAHPAWPFGGPPWSPAILPQMLAWAEQTLQPVGGRADGPPGTLGTPGPARAGAAFTGGLLQLREELAKAHAAVVDNYIDLGYIDPQDKSGIEWNLELETDRVLTRLRDGRIGAQD